MNAPTVAPVDLAAWAQPAPAKGKKSETPEVSLPETEKARRLADVKKLKKDLEAEEAMLSADLTAQAHAKLCELSRAQGKALSSVHVNGILTYVHQCRYSNLTDPAKVEALKAKFNGRFGEFFAPVYTLEVPLEKLDAELVAALQARGIRPTVTLKPTQALHVARVLDPNIAALAESAGIKPAAYLQLKKD